MSNEIVSTGIEPRKPRIAANAANLIGQRFGKLTVICRDGNRPHASGTVKAIWLCQCDCGRQVRRAIDNLTPRSCCGCMHGAVRAHPKKRRKCRLPIGEAARRQLLATYKQQARARGYEWAISNDEFFRLICCPCHYCGCQPASVMKVGIWNGSVTYNGVDRMNNDVGYTTQNAVTCCKTCNRAKGTMSKEQLLEWLHRVCVHLRIGLATPSQPVQ